jgi:GntR family transcriptional regulator
MFKMLLRDPSQPLYAQIERLLLARIGKRYRRGELLPTQQQIAKDTGASLITVKRALSELTRRGIIESVRGRGTVVRGEAVHDNHADISSWTQSISRLGAQPRTAWTRISLRTPPPKLARILGMKARQQSIHLKRLRLVDGVPTCLMTNELPLLLAPGLAEEGLRSESLYAWLFERYGLKPAWADEEVIARAALPMERRLLGADTNIVLMIERLSVLADGRPLEIAEIVAPAHRYRYAVRLVASTRHG